MLVFDTQRAPYVVDPDVRWSKNIWNHRLPLQETLNNMHLVAKGDNSGEVLAACKSIASRRAIKCSSL